MPIPVIGLLVRGAALGFGIALGMHAGRKFVPTLSERLDEAAEDLDIGVKADHDDNPYYTDLFGEDPPPGKADERRHH